MSIGERIACSVLWHFIVLGFYAFDYFVFRSVGASPVWAAGAATAWAVLFVVGVPDWNKNKR